MIALSCLKNLSDVIVNACCFWASRKLIVFQDTTATSKFSCLKFHCVNNRLVYAMRCIGKGTESAVIFRGIVNLSHHHLLSKFNNTLLQAARETCEESMTEAVNETVDENDRRRDIAVAVDGS
ncbi:hypothetical protein NPIL_224451 [Nephila pilipes]|uniref:Uncharacterized protein n=1 Tax=Nephila pilipes TaxID=299642 RepID=A0A8X6JZZ4_NEPPI|nr:hypothetical protein NPIL_224451 [Nephila pilipes]